MKTDKIFRIMQDVPRSCVYILLNEDKKEVYITWSTDVVTSLARNLRDINNKTHVCKRLIKIAKKLEFRVLENVHYHDTKNDIAMKIHYWINEYINNGYTVINKHNIQRYRVKLKVNRDVDKVFVKLINTSYKELVVGVFNNIQEAKEFSKLFNNMSFITPLYAINDLSLQYFKNQDIF